MRRRTIHGRLSLTAFSLILLALLTATPHLVAQEAPPPPPPEEAAEPVPPAHATARATMRTFLQAFDPKFRTAGTDPLDIAASCLDLSAISDNVRAVRGRELAQDLKEVLDRTVLVDYADIPDEPDAEPYTLQIHQAKLDHPGTVTIAPDERGHWLFTEETIERLPAMLQEVRDREIVSGVVREGPQTFSRWLRGKIPTSLQETAFILEHWQWVGIFLLIFLGMILDRLVTALLRGTVRRHMKRTAEILDADALQTALRPVGLLAAAILWIFGITWLDLPTDTLEILNVAVRFVIAASVVWALYRLVDIVAAALEVRAAHTEGKLDDLLVPLVRKTLKVFIVVFGLLFIADSMDLPITSLLTGVGLGGLAVALAAQDTVRNLFGSLTVVLDRPFHVGDWVMIGDVEGVVEEVGFRSTRIRTFYNSLVSLPNANLINASVDNYGARRYRRWSTKLQITYQTPPQKVEEFCEGIRQLIREHTYTRKDFFEVQFNGFGASSLDILLYMFFETPDWSAELRERHRFGLDILRLAHRLGVEFAYPTQTIHLAHPGGAADGMAGGMTESGGTTNGDA